MVQIAGKYKLVKNENFLEYLKAIGLPDEIAAKSEASGHNVTVTVDGNAYIFDKGEKVVTIKVGEEWTEELQSISLKLKNSAKLDGNKLIVTANTDDGRSGTQVYEFSDEGYVHTFIYLDTVAKRHFSRV